jgi:hypothetical protein
MCQRLRSHLTYANVMVTILAFLVLGGGTALASYLITSNSQVGPGTISGHKPPSGAHANIIGGSVNGQDVADNSLGGADINESTLTGDTRRLVWNGGTDGLLHPIATIGPYTLKGQCVFNEDDDNLVRVRLWARGPAGTADFMYGETQNDASDIGTTSNGFLIPANTDTRIVATFAKAPNYRRIAGTAMLRSGSTLVQVDFNAVADARFNACFIYGTATKAT